jgi:hypothetical protein
MSDYKKLAFRPKDQIDGGSLAEGEVDFNHLAPALFSEIRNIQLHQHTGTGSSRLKLQNIDGYFPRAGFVMYSDDGTKRFAITINNAGVLAATPI